MTEQTQALTPYERTRELFKSPEVVAMFEELYGKAGAPRFMASVLNTVYVSDRLRQCEPLSILTAARQAAVLQLVVDPNIGFACMVPYKNRTKIGDRWVTKDEAQFQIQWKGLVQLAIRSQLYEYLNADAIHEGMEIHKDILSGKIMIAGSKSSDEVIGYFGYFMLKDGMERYEYMTVEEVHAHAKRYSKSYGNENSAWTTNFPEMAKKTLIKKVLKYGPLSIEMKNALKEDKDNGFEREGEVIEGEARDIRAEAAAVREEIETQSEPEPSPEYEEPTVEQYQEERSRRENPQNEPEPRPEPEPKIDPHESAYYAVADELGWSPKIKADTLKLHGGDYKAALEYARKQKPRGEKTD